MSPPDSLSLQDGYKYRKQRGINLGSWFVLEKWITPSPFTLSGVPNASCDLDIARSPNAKAILEEHWDTWINEDDWNWLEEHGINSVRVPIGYYHLMAIDKHVVKHTDFERFGHVFEGAWKKILDAVDTASRHGIGVLIDLHSAVGKQNADSHSGVNGTIRFYEKRNLEKTLDVLRLLVRHLSHLSNIVGIQLVNEPQNNLSLPDWYTKSLNKLRKEKGGETIPLYIHDAWNIQQYAELVGLRKDFTVVDHHLYRCFTHSDRQISGDEHASALRSSFLPHLSSLSSKANGNLVIAEYSSALNPSSLRSSEPSEQDRQRRVFTRSELEVIEKCCGGSWFWNLKKQAECGWDAGWSLRDSTRAEIAPPFYGLRRTRERYESDDVMRDQKRNAAFDAHVNYWNQYPGKYEHDRFPTGFDQGWSDAYLFFNFSPVSPKSVSISELGFKGEWVKRRVREHIKFRGKSKFIWEFEHGFMQGVDAARDSLN